MTRKPSALNPLFPKPRPAADAMPMVGLLSPTLLRHPHAADLARVLLAQPKVSADADA